MGIQWEKEESSAYYGLSSRSHEEGWLERKEAQMRKLDEQCAICGGQLIEKNVEKLLKGGSKMASCKLSAEVCYTVVKDFIYPKQLNTSKRLN